MFNYYHHHEHDPRIEKFIMFAAQRLAFENLTEVQCVELLVTTMGAQPFEAVNAVRAAVILNES
jgi:hypothetical protein